MGELIWHEYARLVSITASVYAVWAGFFGLLYRKFFWDFIGGTLRDPGGLQAPPSAALFVTLIIKAPIIPIVTMIIGMIILAIELPLPMVKSTGIYRSLPVRIILLLFQTFFAILFYQGVNAAIYSFIAAGCYMKATARGEVMHAAKENRGTIGDA